MEGSTMASRKLNPTERRLTMRESFRYYHVIVVAGIYHFSNQDKSNDPLQPNFYFPALKRTIQTHPILAAVVKDAATDNERYIQVQNIDLNNHINILDTEPQDSVPASEDHLIACIIGDINNKPELAMFERPQEIPPWRLDILPLDASCQRIFISFTYSHCVGDGMSGSIFHDTFLAALNEKNPSVDACFETKEASIPSLPHLPVSLSFLLAPALGHYLPKFISNFLGLKASVSGSDNDTWLGSNVFDDRLSLRRSVNTAVQVFSLDHETLSAVVKACRSHNTKLTALLNELIALCISRRVTNYYARFTQKTNLVSSIPTNLRKVSGVPADTLGNFGGVTYSQHPIVRSPEITVGEDVWSRARVQSAHIAESVIRLQDQVTALLGWISDMRTWMEGQLGQARDSSWQLSNLMAFDGGKRSIAIEKMFFCQPADLVGLPINFNTVSVKGGDLAICVSWQVGALGLDRTEKNTSEDKEHDFIDEVLQDLRAYLDHVAQIVG